MTKKGDGGRGNKGADVEFSILEQARCLHNHMMHKIHVLLRNTTLFTFRQ
jgi:hypothetical protein